MKKHPEAINSYKFTSNLLYVYFGNWSNDVFFANPASPSGLVRLGSRFINVFARVIEEQTVVLMVSSRFREVCVGRTYCRSE